MELETKHLRLVQAIAEEGTQTGAARRLFLTQSALSHQLKELERRIGTPLFHRLGRSMAPTLAGRRVLEAGDRILPRLAELSTELRDIARGLIGQIRVTTQCYTCYNWLPTVLPPFREAHPGFEIRIVADAATSAIEAVRNASVDLALAYDFDPDESLDMDPLWSDELVAILHPNHPLASRGFLEATDFAEENLVLYMNEIEDTYLYKAVLEPGGIQPRRTTPLRLTEGIVAMVAGGGGISVVTRWTVAREIAAGTLAAVRVTEMGLRREWYAVRAAQLEKEAALDHLVELLRGGPGRLFDDPGMDEARRVAGITLPPRSMWSAGSPVR